MYSRKKHCAHSRNASSCVEGPQARRTRERLGEHRLAKRFRQRCRIRASERRCGSATSWARHQSLKFNCATAFSPAAAIPTTTATAVTNTAVFVLLKSRRSMDATSANGTESWSP